MVADTGTASARLRRHYPNDDPGVEPLATDLQRGASGGGGSDADAQTRELSSALVAAGDRCAVCDAPLAVDQRYCVECGERRGKPRFPSSPSADATQAPAPRARSARRPRVSPGATLVAGVATLLLALGVGVLIGHSGNSGSSQRASAPPVQVVKLSGGGGGGGAVAAAKPPTPAATRAKAKAKAAPKVSAEAKAKAAAVSHKASAAASKVLGTSAAKLPPPTVTVGAPGHGAGYQHGHFTGTFFGQ